MKIPGAQSNRQVQSLGRRNVDAPQQVARAEASAANAWAGAADAEVSAARWKGADLMEYGQAVQHLGGMMKDVQETQGIHEGQQAFLRAQSTLGERTLMRSAGGVTEINNLPDAVQAKLPETDTQFTASDNDGTQSTVPNATVPYWKVATSAYEADSNAVAGAELANLSSPYAQKAFNGAWAKYTAAGRSKVLSEAVKEATSFYKTESVQMAEQALQAGDPLAAKSIIDSRVQSGLFNPYEGMTVWKDLLKDHETNAIESVEMRAAAAAEDGDIQGMQAANADMAATLAYLQSDEYSGQLSPKERRIAIEQLEGRIVHTEKAFDDVTAVERGMRNMKLELGVDAGKLGPQQILEAFQLGDIKEGQATKLMRRYAKGVASAKKAGIDASRFTEAMQRGMPLDGLDKDARKFTDSLYMRDRTPENGLSTANATSVMPPTFAADLVRASHSDNPQTVAGAARSVSKLYEMDNGHMVKALPQNASSKLLLVSKYLDAGAAPEQALLLANNMQRMKPDEQREFIEEYSPLSAENQADLETRFNAEDGTSVVTAVFDPDTWGDPTARAKISGQYDRLVRANYAMTGEIETSREAAYEAIKGIWGATTATPDGSQKIMEYSPERVFKVTDGKAALAAFAKANDLDPERVFIQSDYHTEASGGLEGYAVFVNGDRGPEARPDLRWVPTPRQNAAAMEEARRKEVLQEQADVAEQLKNPPKNRAREATDTPGRRQRITQGERAAQELQDTQPDAIGEPDPDAGLSM